ncbi:MAG: hypothetical protein IKN63_04025 [Bacilli bacterium]|nr:hypothetical protein [Bacilli bacterium]
MNEKYYQIALRNVFLPNPKTEIVYAYLDCGIYRELLTKKEIYYTDINERFNIEEFNQNDYKLIGIAVLERDAYDVSKFLKFLTQKNKNEIINRLNLMEESVKCSLEMQKFLTTEPEKRLKKSDFLKKF